MSKQTKYSIYIPSKGRAKSCITANMLQKDNIDFKIVVEPQDYKDYCNEYSKDKILKLPFSELGLGVYPARNWIKEYSISKKETFHWQLDDDLRFLAFYTKGKHKIKPPSEILKAVENFSDRYKNIGITGVSSRGFAFSKNKPFGLNQQVYCCILYRNELPYKWRCKADDTDMSLQVLKGGWCTVNMNAFVFDSKVTGERTKGGNSTDVYNNDGRLLRARHLKNLHPDLPIRITKKFGRTHQDLNQVWKLFKQPLVRYES